MFVSSTSFVKDYSEIQIIKSSTSRYQDNLFDIDSIYLKQMIDQICLIKLQLNKANFADTETPCLDLHLSWLINGIILETNVMILILTLSFFPFVLIVLYLDFLRMAIHTSTCSFRNGICHLSIFCNCNYNVLTAKLISQVHQYHKPYFFSKFYLRHAVSIDKCNKLETPSATKCMGTRANNSLVYKLRR